MVAARLVAGRASMWLSSMAMSLVSQTGVSSGCWRQRALVGQWSARLR